MRIPILALCLGSGMLSANAQHAGIRQQLSDMKKEDLLFRGDKQYRNKNWLLIKDEYYIIFRVSEFAVRHVDIILRRERQAALS